jgi:peptidylprolyl isomerase
MAQDFSDSEKQILVYRDSRSLGENRELIGFLDSKSDVIVIKTLYALADIADSTTIDDIAEILNSTHNENIRSSAAFALGQIPCGKSIGYLTKALNTESSFVVLVTVLDALGKVGNENSLSTMLNYKNDNEIILKAMTLSVARFALRGIRSEEGIIFLKNIINRTSDIKTNRFAAYGLFRTRSKSLLSPIHNDILNLTKNKDAFIRMWAFSALGNIADINDIDYVLTSLNNEESWQVKVNILNSLPLYKKTSEAILNEKLVDAVTYKYDDANPNVIHTALRVTALLFSDLAQPNQNLQTIKDRLEWFFPPDKAVEWQDKCEAILAYGTIFKDDVKQELLLKMSETENEDLIPYIIKSFQFFKDGMVYNELTDSVGKRVQRYNKMHNQDFGDMVQDETLAKVYGAYVEVLSVLKNKVDKKNQEKIMLILSNFTASKDPSILDVCFTALNDSIYYDLRNNIKMVLLMDYKELVYPKNKDAMILFINEFGELQMKEAENILKENLNSPNYDICRASANALKKITGNDYTFKTKPKTDFDWEFIKNLPSKRFATINTNRGKIKIEMLINFAPLTVQNFIKLAEKKFYDGTIFHRIVPNFVIQGGDPLNNGYGGPEFSIRSEFSGFNYEEGAVGMASDGKDTEGSQFFIMHSPHYHLDGKYTLFGYVAEGQDVVDHIMPYDKIIGISFTEN